MPESGSGRRYRVGQSDAVHITNVLDFDEENDFALALVAFVELAALFW